MFVATVAAIALQQAHSDPVLLALTPVLDGRLAVEEWLPLGAAGFFQWEPGIVHFAAQAKSGEEVVVSIDVDGDGWLRGTDNREVRIAMVGGTPTATVRSLDTTGRGGPAWRVVTGPSLNLVGASNGDTWVIEGSLSLGRSVAEGEIVGALVTTEAAGGQQPAPYVPRPLQYFRYGFDQANGLPKDATWRSDPILRETAREDGLTMGFEVKNGGTFTTAVLRGEGYARNDLSISSLQVPTGTTRRFEFKSAITASALPGWRVLQAQIGDATLRTSFKVSELIEIAVDLPDKVSYSARDREVKGSVTVRSSGVGRIEGQYDVAADPAWTVRRGGSQRVLIYNPRGREHINLTFLVPGGSQGEFSVRFFVTVGEQTFTRTALVEVLPPGTERPGQ